MFQSGVFPAATIRDWKKKPTNDQTHADAKTFFQAEHKGLTEVHRLIGDTPQGYGYEVAAAALERGLDTVLENFNERVEERVQEAVDAGIRQLSMATRPNEQVNAATERDINQLRDQLATLTSSMTSLQREVASLATAVRKSGTKPTTTQVGGDGPGGLKWKAGMRCDPTWTTKQKFWWSGKVKTEDPKRYREHMKQHYMAKLKELE